jgi:protein-tyrosine phosphatase
MNWITDSIAIGNFADAQDSSLLIREGVVAVLGLIDTLSAVEPLMLGVSDIRIVEMEDSAHSDVATFLRAVEVLGELIQQHSKVLVHCHAGRSRSAVVVAGYLMKAMNLDADQAIELISSRREIYLTPGMLRLLYSL